MKSGVSGFYTCPMLLVFFSAVAVRLLPELLSFPYPIGFDTVFYGWRIQTGAIWDSSTGFFSTWLFYGLAIPLRNVLQVGPFVLLKVLAPLIYGVNAVGVYYFARRALLWSPKYASLAGFLFMFQLASLRLSWDLYRNVLGLGILLFALPWALRIEDLKGFLAFLLLSVLVVFSHEYVGTVLVFVLGGMLLSKLVKRDVKSALKIGAVFFVCLAFLLATVQFSYMSVADVKTNVTEVHDVIYPRGIAPNFSPNFFVNYLNRGFPVSYSSYLGLFGDVLLLFLALYALLLPLVSLGFFRHLVLDLWSLFLLVGVFHVLVSPFFALDFWSRLMFMLIYPFTFYAVNGFKKACESAKGIHLRLGRLRGFFSTRMCATVLILALVLLGLFYVALPRRMLSLGSYSFPPPSVHFPGVFLANTVLVEDTTDLKQALMWLDARLASLGSESSGVIVQDAVLWWTKLYLGDQHHLFHFYRYVDDAVRMAVQQGCRSVFFVWWRTKSNLYPLSVPSYFVSVFNNDKFSVYEFDYGSGDTLVQVETKGNLADH